MLRLTAEGCEPTEITLWPDLPLLPSGKPDQRALRQASVAVAHSGAWSECGAAVTSAPTPAKSPRDRNT